jgi:hypothetical protein
MPFFKESELHLNCSGALNANRCTKLICSLHFCLLPCGCYRRLVSQPQKVKHFYLVQKPVRCFKFILPHEYRGNTPRVDGIRTTHLARETVRASLIHLRCQTSHLNAIPSPFSDLIQLHIIIFVGKAKVDVDLCSNGEQIVVVICRANCVKLTRISLN